MAWIESHQSLLHHKKTNRAVAFLKCDRYKFIGHMQALWWWCLDNAPDGDLSELMPAEIAEAAGWPVKHGDLFVEALVFAGFLDSESGGWRLHKWGEYTERLMARREAGRKGGIASGEARRALKQMDEANEAIVQANGKQPLNTNQPTSSSSTNQPTNQPTNLRHVLDLTPADIQVIRVQYPTADINARWCNWISWIEEEKKRGRNKMPRDKLEAFLGWLRKNEAKQGSAAGVDC